MSTSESPDALEILSNVVDGLFLSKYPIHPVRPYLLSQKGVVRA